MNEEKIEQLLRKTFLAAIPTASGNTAFENQAFNPKGKAKWYKFTMFPAKPVVATLGSIGEDKFTGLAQIDINTQTGRGREGNAEDVSALRGAFMAGTHLIDLPVNVVIRSCGVTGIGREVNGYFRVSLAVNYEARISRNIVVKPLTLTGLPYIGNILRAAGGRGRVQWLLDGLPVSGLGGYDYFVTSEDYGKIIAWTDGSEISPALMIGNPPVVCFAFEIDTNGNLMLHSSNEPAPLFTIENGDLIFEHTSENAPNLQINESGNLILTL